MANTIGAQDAFSIWLQLGVVPKVRPLHRHLLPNQKPKTRNPMKFFRSEKLACPLQERIARIFKEEESETAGRLKDGITTKKAFFSTG
jgi:sigma54-dependent transcription regulator